MILIIQNNLIAATATDEYQSNGTEQAVLTAPAGFDLALMADYQYANGAVMLPVPNPVPQSITSYQAKAALSNAGLYTTVNTYMNGTAPIHDQLAWQEQITFSRSDAIIAAMAGPLNLSSAELDTLFIAAALINP